MRYDPRFRLLIVRHGESVGNVDRSIHKLLPDNALTLTPKGHEQAHEAGKFVQAFFRQQGLLSEYETQKDDRRGEIVAASEFLEANPAFKKGFPKIAKLPNELPANPHVRLWYSPFKRTQETKDGIVEEARDVITDQRENPYIYEILFGLNDGLPDDAILQAMPEATHHYDHYSKGGGRYFVPMLLGESRADVAQRCINLFDSIHRDAQDSDIWNHVIVTHGLTARILAKVWMKYSIEQFDLEKNPGNCWVRYLEGHGKKAQDHDWIYKGDPEQIRQMQSTMVRG